ncbi:hypothetical protein Q1695_003795 [Nippostrongylus brasiliensis]|nr:hypothetical protein Q1695_003795 [Nippostrongylus brasiliensis]
MRKLDNKSQAKPPPAEPKSAAKPTEKDKTAIEDKKDEKKDTEKASEEKKVEEKKDDEKKDEEKKDEKKDEDKKDEKKDEEKKDEKKDEDKKDEKKDEEKKDEKKDEEKKDEKKDEEKKDEKKDEEKKDEKKDEEKKDEEKKDEKDEDKKDLKLEPTPPTKELSKAQTPKGGGMKPNEKIKLSSTTLGWEEKPSQQVLKVTNETGEKQALKVKCSNNNMYKVNPVYTIVDKGKTVDIVISRSGGPVKPEKLEVLTTPTDGADAKQAFNAKDVSPSLVPVPLVAKK